MNTNENQKQFTEKKIKDSREAEPNDVVLQQTLADRTIYDMTKEEFDLVVDVFALLAKWDRELKQKQKAEEPAITSEKVL